MAPSSPSSPLSLLSDIHSHWLLAVASRASRRQYLNYKLLLKLQHHTDTTVVVVCLFVLTPDLDTTVVVVCLFVLTPHLTLTLFHSSALLEGTMEGLPLPLPLPQHSTKW